MDRSYVKRQLVWLPWHGGSPPFGPKTRVQLACWLLRMQSRATAKLPRSRPWTVLGPNVFEARVPDHQLNRAITYQVCQEAVIVIEVLPDDDKFREHTFLRLRRLRDFHSRWPDLDGSAWQTGDPAAFLQLNPEQSAQVEIRVAMANRLKAIRLDRRWTHDDLAAALGSSRSRVAKMEGADVSVSLDLLTRSLMALGVTRLQLAVLIGRGPETVHETLSFLSPDADAPNAGEVSALAGVPPPPGFWESVAPRVLSDTRHRYTET